MDDLADHTNRIVSEEGLSGVVRIDLDGRVAFQAPYGMAHRGLGVANRIDTQFSIASGSKGLTALAVMSLVEHGQLSLDTTARSILGDDLPLIDDGVTVEHLLAHRSGIGDYIDEEVLDDSNEYVMTVPVQELATTEQFLRVLDGHPTKFAPGDRFVYCNGGYVVLALIAERVSGVPYHVLVEQRVCGPAGMVDTAFLRSDELPGRAALGYLHDQGLRTNVFHLPVRANGDGGVYTTAADIHALWDALFAGRIVSSDTVAEMVRPRSESPSESLRYGLGFWLHESDLVALHGFDAGSAFVSAREPGGRFTYTVISNKTGGAWPVSQRIEELLTQ
ncbi:MAG: serine hydrolase domain-containing protein [Acidimicrobiales bacterium]